MVETTEVRAVEGDEHCPAPSAMTVFYDGACPLCRRETDFYRNCQGGGTIRWVDANADDEALRVADLTRADALARFHVRLADGSLESGPRGFGALWAALPGFRWLGIVAQSSVLQWPLEIAYRCFLYLRPIIQRAAMMIEVRK